MFGVLRQLNTPKLSAGILLWSLYIFRFMGAVGLRLKTTSDKRVAVEDSSLKWKWSSAIIRIGCQTIFMTMFFSWDVPNVEYTEHFLHLNRFVLQFGCCMSILRLQILQGHEVTKLVNNLLQLFRRVQDYCNGNHNGFGGKSELIVLLFMILSFIHEEIYILNLVKPYWNLRAIIAVFADTYLSFGIKTLTYFACLWYISLALLYSDINDFVRSELRTLDLQPTNGKLRKTRKNVRKCLDLYRDLNSLASAFQKVYDFPLVFGLGYNGMCSLLFAYLVIIRIKYDMILLCSNTVNELLNIFILAWSVQRAVVKSGEIRLLMLDNSSLSKIRNWQKNVCK